MNILFLTENFPPETNAAASRVFERACYWVTWGHNVTVITCVPNFPEGKVHSGYQNKWYQVEMMSGIRVVRVKTFIAKNEGIFLRSIDFISFMFSATIAGLFQKRPDVVVATSPQLFTAVGGWLLSALRRLPFVFELGDLWPASISALGAMKNKILLNILEIMELFLYRHSAAIIALTSSFKKDLVKRGVLQSKIAVIINGVDLSRFSQRSRCEMLASQYGLEGKFVVGYIGTHGVSHALENVLLAAEELRDKKDIHFIFVGAGVAREGLLNKAKQNRLQNVIFVPRQPKENMPEIWSLCDIVLIHLKKSKIFETVIPSKIFEAMGMGLPMIVCAPKGEASRIVEKEHAGIWVPPEKPAALAKMVDILKNNDALRNTLAKNSHRAASKYDRERQARNVLSTLENVIAGKGCNVAEVVKG